MAMILRTIGQFLYLLFFAFLPCSSYSFLKFVFSALLYSVKSNYHYHYSDLSQSAEVEINCVTNIWLASSLNSEVYIYMYVYIYIYSCIYIHIHGLHHPRILRYIHLHIYLNIYKYTYKYIYIYIYKCMACIILKF
jgi:hypothetical protein